MGRPDIDVQRTAYSPDILTATITISTSTTVSAEVDLDGGHLFAISTPSALTGTAITFKVSDVSGGTFNDLYDDTGTKYSVVVAPSRVIYLDPTKFAAFRYIKLVSGSAEAADRVIKLFTRVV